jgi:rhodanese-related sulfurtransferase
MVAMREVSPVEAWRDLNDNTDALLVDVRTQAEWAFVGGVDLSQAAASALYVEWARLPAMTPNPDFARTVADAVAAHGAARVYFLCRSGGRSGSAAAMMAQVFSEQGRTVDCVNVAEGFEGDLDAEGRRGRTGGWKARGLPWRQS